MTTENLQPPEYCGYGVTPILVVADAAGVLTLLESALDAKTYFKYSEEGKEDIMHSATEINGMTIQVEDSSAALYKDEKESTPAVRLAVCIPAGVRSALEQEQKFVAAGGSVAMPTQDMFWGGKYGVLRDPEGFLWAITDKEKEDKNIPNDIARRLIPEISVKNAEKYIEFLKSAFDAEIEFGPMKTPEGKVIHSTILVNGGKVMVCDVDSFGEGGDAAISPCFNVSDAVKTSEKLLKNGGTIVMPIEEQFWGDIYGVVNDSVSGVNISLIQEVKKVKDSIVKANVEIGEKYQYKWKWEEAVMPEYRIAGMEDKGVHVSEFPKWMGDNIPRLMSALGDGAHHREPLMEAIYACQDNRLDFFTGVPVQENESFPDLPSDISIRKVGGERTISTLHRGPYEELPKAWKAITEFIEAAGYIPAYPAYEVYVKVVDDHESLETRIYHSYRTEDQRTCE